MFSTWICYQPAALLQFSFQLPLPKLVTSRLDYCNSLLYGVLKIYRFFTEIKKLYVVLSLAHPFRSSKNYIGYRSNAGLFLNEFLSPTHNTLSRSVPCELSPLTLLPNPIERQEIWFRNWLHILIYGCPYILRMLLSLSESWILLTPFHFRAPVFALPNHDMLRQVHQMTLKWHWTLQVQVYKNTLESQNFTPILSTDSFRLFTEKRCIVWSQNDLKH